MKSNRREFLKGLGALAAAPAAGGCVSSVPGVAATRSPNGRLRVAAGIGITDDALELLKSSSLFQKINDKNLALGIIKAYDYLNADSQAFNTHEKYKTALYGEVNTDKAKKAAMIYAGPDFLKLFYSSKEGDYFIKSVIDMSKSAFMESGLPEIESTIAAIEERLHP